MKYYPVTFFASFFLILLLVSSDYAYAQEGNAFTDGLEKARSQAETSGLFQGDVDDFITSAIRLALSFVGLIATAAIIYGGFLYITALDDGKKLESAKRIIIYAVIGLIVIGAAALITNVIITTFS